MIGIRTDANSVIATGHMMRCITIAKALVKLGQEVTFFIADKESETLLKSGISDWNEDKLESSNKLNAENGSVKIVVLESNWQDMDGELDTLITKLQLFNVATLLVDSYMVTENYFDRLKDICRIAYLDDLCERAYSIDLLINYSGYSGEMGYEAKYAGREGFCKTPTKFLLGLKFAPLREQFYTDIEDKEFAEEDFVNDPNILLSTGGADTCEMIVPFLREVTSRGLNEKASWHVVVGDYVKEPDKIKAFIDSTEGIFMHRSVRNMAELMKKCDVAVMAAGTMLTECAATHLPTVFYQVADNQKYNVKFWKEVNGMAFAGDVSTSEDAKEIAINSICNEINDIISDAARLNAMTEGIGSITDGRGAIRIAEELIAQ
ncbi:UDP-2,4-diacetamido-2,4,6-trideoxy-beta-L-altropyranose hydrolase [Butyrivibrio sp. YAB3001]|uniref:UDP-2,4-diacetamido-2,4, 6-trideoxy-beta-L-altropyranose hydrolase n=1 Tax=Butyrivibrio sp. YAB3001 TaxID=1520812 RepID=UPI0008F65D3A|nr:UDP-2,4-diacetamido-2,4,6-trideoxy-beta-L-altropyranose hydrolase [Butyrivibrio sp. YAB3001]SFC17018.1 UDP-2,4-diacetamido-2,4,6-trideoxy-beta-L-altropyranose hydrolase [Butyrivibrio sp. YAB3001]